MKRILIALAVLLSVQLSNAQQVVKTPDAAKKALEKAEAASQDAKKAAKVATWTKLANAYMDAYNAPIGSAWLGASQQELKLIMGEEQPISSENVVLNGEQFLKEVYANKEFYFNTGGQLVLINVTDPVVEYPLTGAYKAFVQAHELDVKGSKLKDITAGLENISKKMYDEGMNCYMLGNYAEASKYFENAADAAAAAPLHKVDSTSLYNSGFTAWMIKDYPRAKAMFEKCLAVNYYYEGGEVYAKLADINNNLGDKEAAVKVLEEGFVKFPQSQSILIGLINHYLEDGDNTDRLFVLIDAAKKNEPNNASLHYVEGNIQKQLGNMDAAIAAYYRCTDINPDYEFGYIGAGILYYEEAIKIQEKAQDEYDDKKYEALIAEFDKMLENAIEPFEKAYAISKDEELKLNIAEYLKNIYYRFSSKGEPFDSGYKKYDEIVRNGRA